MMSGVELQARLLREETLTLEKATSLCQADEESRKQLKDLTKEGNVNIYSLEKNAKKKGIEKKKWKQRQDKPRMPPNLPNKSCGNCGQHHPKRQCLANHFERCCHSKNVHGVDESRHTDHDNLFVGTVNKNRGQTKTEIKKDECFVTLDIQDMPVRFKVDTGSQANIIPVSIYRKLKEPKAPLQTSKTSLTSYTGDKLHIIGKYTMKCMNKHLNVFVSETNQSPILGFKRRKSWR